MLRTLFRRKCGNSDFRARLDDVKCENNFAYKNRCLNVRSATANKKKNKNVKQNRRIKSIIRTNRCQPIFPNDKRRMSSHESAVFSTNNAGISKKFISFDSDEVIRA